MFLNGLDQLDQKIVELLIGNARMSYSEIGDQVGISRVAVKARVQALEERGVIEGYTTLVNPQQIGGAISCYFDIETEPGALGGVTAALESCGMVTQIYRVTGKSRIHVHAVASSQEEMEDFIRNVIDRLDGVIMAECSVILSRIKDVKGLRL